MKPELRERRGRCYQGKCGLLERLRQRRAPSPYAAIGIVGKVLPSASALVLQASAVWYQCDMRQQIGELASRSRVTPPKIHSPRRLCPYAPVTSRSAPSS